MDNLKSLWDNLKAQRHGRPWAMSGRASMAQVCMGTYLVLGGCAVLPSKVLRKCVRTDVFLGGGVVMITEGLPTPINEAVLGVIGKSATGMDNPHDHDGESVAVWQLQLTND